MTDSEANEIRLIANEIMLRLYKAGQRDQLNLLRIYAVRAIKEIDKKPNAAGSSAPTLYNPAECAMIREPEMVKKYPAMAILHTPSGPLYACWEHVRAAENVYGVLGCHVMTSACTEKVACINCINEAKGGRDELGQ